MAQGSPKAHPEAALSAPAVAMNREGETFIVEDRPEARRLVALAMKPPHPGPDDHPAKCAGPVVARRVDDETVRLVSVCPECGRTRTDTLARCREPGCDRPAEVGIGYVLSSMATACGLTHVGPSSAEMWCGKHEPPANGVPA